MICKVNKLVIENRNAVVSVKYLLNKYRDYIKKKELYIFEGYVYKKEKVDKLSETGLCKLEMDVDELLGKFNEILDNNIYNKKELEKISLKLNKVAVILERDLSELGCIPVIGFNDGFEVYMFQGGYLSSKANFFGRKDELEDLEKLISFVSYKSVRYLFNKKYGREYSISLKLEEKAKYKYRKIYGIIGQLTSKHGIIPRVRNLEEKKFYVAKNLEKVLEDKFEIYTKERLKLLKEFMNEEVLELVSRLEEEKEILISERDILCIIYDGICKKYGELEGVRLLVECNQKYYGRCVTEYCGGLGADFFISKKNYKLCKFIYKKLDYNYVHVYIGSEKKNVKSLKSMKVLKGIEFYDNTLYVFKDGNIYVNIELDNLFVNYKHVYSPIYIQEFVHDFLKGIPYIEIVNCYKNFMLWGKYLKKYGLVLDESNTMEKAKSLKNNLSLKKESEKDKLIMDVLSVIEVEQYESGYKVVRLNIEDIICIYYKYLKEKYGVNKCMLILIGLNRLYIKKGIDKKWL